MIELLTTDLLAMETLRVHRPRIILYGPSGMGQSYVTAAALHHLEGFHVQTLDIANLMSDSTRVRTLYSALSLHSYLMIMIDSRGGDCSTVCRSETPSALGSIHSLT